MLTVPAHNSLNSPGSPDSRFRDRIFKTPVKRANGAKDNNFLPCSADSILGEPLHQRQSATDTATMRPIELASRSGVALRVCG